MFLAFVFSIVLSAAMYALDADKQAKFNLRTEATNLANQIKNLTDLKSDPLVQKLYTKAEKIVAKDAMLRQKLETAFNDYQPGRTRTDIKRLIDQTEALAEQNKGEIATLTNAPKLSQTASEVKASEAQANDEKKFFSNKEGKSHVADLREQLNQLQMQHNATGEQAP